MLPPATHAGLAPAEQLRSHLSVVRQAWPQLSAGVTPAPSGVRGRSGKSTPPLPENELLFSGRLAVERFTWTYVSLLMRRGAQVRGSAKCETARALTWVMPQGATVRQALDAIDRHLRFFVGHPSAPVAWGFALEVEGVAKHVKWALPSRPVRIATAIPCAHRLEGCKGVYEIESVTGEVALSGSSSRVAVCCADDSHRCPVEELGA